MNKKDQWIAFRVTPAEKDKIKKDAEDQARTLPSYLRYILLTEK